MTYEACMQMSESAGVERPAENWRLMLVNAENPIPRGRRARVSEAEPGVVVDERIVAATRALLDGCRAAGMEPRVTSSWRSRWTQTAILAQRASGRILRGRSPRSAWRMTRMFVALPGTSEHELGLAIDVCSAEQDEASDARLHDWLAGHAWEFGFIQRYPTGKSQVTGILHEPWHYRYVGRAAAREMTERGLCLEEYLEARSSRD